jgi:hypothetical protein
VPAATAVARPWIAVARDAGKPIAAIAAGVFDATSRAVGNRMRSAAGSTVAPPSP